MSEVEDSAPLDMADGADEPFELDDDWLNNDLDEADEEDNAASRQVTTPVTTTPAAAAAPDLSREIGVSDIRPLLATLLAPMRVSRIDPSFLHCMAHLSTLFVRDVMNNVFSGGRAMNPIALRDAIARTTQTLQPRKKSRRFR